MDSDDGRLAPVVDGNSGNDEGPRRDTSLDALAKLKPAFHVNGSVTADGLKKLATKKWSKLDLGANDTGETAAP